MPGALRDPFVLTAAAACALLVPAAIGLGVICTGGADGEGDARVTLPDANVLLTALGRAAPELAVTSMGRISEGHAEAAAPVLAVHEVRIGGHLAWWLAVPRTGSCGACGNPSPKTLAGVLVDRSGTSAHRVFPLTAVSVEVEVDTAAIIEAVRRIVAAQPEPRGA